MDKAEKAAPAVTDFWLAVVHPFADFVRGDMVRDPVEVAAILAGDNAHHVNRVPKQ